MHKSNIGFEGGRDEPKRGRDNILRRRKKEAIAVGKKRRKRVDKKVKSN